MVVCLTLAALFMAAHFYATWLFLLIGGVTFGFGAACYQTAVGHYLNTVSIKLFWSHAFNFF